MNFELLIFYIYAALMLFGAFRVITASNPVHAALYLVLTFACCSALWLLLEAEFLAIALVLVYVGAVMVLFLFVVMMLDINIAPLRERFIHYLPVAVLIGLVVIAQMIMVLGPWRFGLDKVAAPARRAADYSNTREIGIALYTDYLYPFEIAAVILLVAIIAAIALTMRKGLNTKYQNPSKQVRVSKQDRLRIIKMKSEKNPQMDANERR
jgi:NADH-quinone oxidoreductase subunit J